MKYPIPRRLGLFLLLILPLLMLMGLPAYRSALAAAMQQDHSQQGTGQPDLVVESVTLTPPNPAPGTKADITVKVKNNGDAPTTNFVTYLYVDPIENPPVITSTHTARQSYNLAPGATFSFAKTAYTITTTTPRIYAWVDRDNQVAESNEANNLFTFSMIGTPDLYEEDDECAAAKPIQIDTPAQAHNLARQGGTVDIDWVTFAGKAGTTYVASALAIGTDAAPIIQSRKKCDDQSLSGGSIITLTPIIDTTYYLLIAHKADDYAPDYSYTLVVQTHTTCLDQPEPNNSCSESVWLSADNPSIQSAFCAQNDIDWYRFPVIAGGRYTVTANSNGSGDLKMRLFESCTSAGSEHNFEQTFVASEPGFAYLNVQQQRLFGFETEYEINLKQDTTTGCEEDDYDKFGDGDDSTSTATTITGNGEPQRHESCPAGDQDWVKFEAQPGKTYTIESFDLAAKSDTTLCLYAANYKQLECDDDSGSGKGSRLRIENNAATYYLQFSQLDSQLAGPATEYSLQVIEGDCLPDAYEPDDQRERAKPINPAQPRHNICQRYDVDWIKFEAAAQTAYIIETENLDPDADTILELTNAAGTLLASNDDFTPGFASRINYTVTVAGSYFVKVKLYNSTRFGAGTDYTLTIRHGIAPPWSSVFAPSAGQPQLPFPTTGIYRTLILVNAEQVAKLYTQTQTDQLLQKLERLADAPAVTGTVVLLDQIPEVRAAYDLWLADIDNIGKANQVAHSIRNLIKRIRQEEGRLEYIVLVGDDRAIPFYRIFDEVPNGNDEDVEQEYAGVNTSRPTGVALRANYYLSDDFYATRFASISGRGSDLYIPDLALGRLIETPATMISMIDHFLDKPETPVQGVLVTGWDFVIDVATANCTQWSKNLTAATPFDCSLISKNWKKQDFDRLRLADSPTFNIQSINGHALHYADATPDNYKQTATEILTGSGDIQGGLIYSLGCHSGLNVPNDNSGDSSVAGRPYQPLDLPEAFMRRGANYIGNTGYGYGDDGLISHSEKLMLNLTEELGRETFGKALMIAKQRFLKGLLLDTLTPYEEKVAQELVYYGLPMARIPAAPASLGAEFPGVALTFAAPSLGAGTVISQSGTLDLSKGKFELISTANGVYSALSGHAAMAANQPVQPVFYSNLPDPYRSVVLRGGVYSITTGVDPVIVTPINEYTTITSELSAATTFGWQPEFPLALQNIPVTQTTIVAMIGQHETVANRSRQYRLLNFELLASDITTDSIPPFVTIVAARLDEKSNQVHVKVGAIDAAGIHAVIVAYFEESASEQGNVKSLSLSFDVAQQKWVGSFVGNDQTKFLVQVIDNAALTQIVTDKGRYFTGQAAAPDPAPPEYRVYLPTIER